MKKKPKEGWGWPAMSRKAHYFVNGRSLCGRWMYFGKLYSEDFGEDNCKSCLKKLNRKRRLLEKNE